MLANTRKTSDLPRARIATASGLHLAIADAADLDALVRLAVASAQEAGGDEEAIRACLAALVDWGGELDVEGRGRAWCARAHSSSGRLLGLVLERYHAAMRRMEIDVWFGDGVWGEGYSLDLARELKSRREDRHWSTEAESMLASPPALLRRVDLCGLLRLPSAIALTAGASLP